MCFVRVFVDMNFVENTVLFFVDFFSLPILITNQNTEVIISPVDLFGIKLVHLFPFLLHFYCSPF